VRDLTTCVAKGSASASGGQPHPEPVEGDAFNLGHPRLSLNQCFFRSFPVALLDGAFDTSVLFKTWMMFTTEHIKAFAKSCFSDARGSHDWDHSQRVCNLCMHIGQVEGADLKVLEIAAYLHDVGRPHEDKSKGGICHAKKGADIARKLLAEERISAEQRANIIHCIRSHRFRGNHQPETLEAKVLFDADKLDAIGAVGIGRAFLFAGEVGAKLHNPSVEPANTNPYTEEDTGYREYKLKLSKIRDRMLTAEGRRMAEERHAFMEMFFRRFTEEHEGHK
jgi:uncharacterized protein